MALNAPDTCLNSASSSSSQLGPLGHHDYDTHVAKEDDNGTIVVEDEEDLSEQGLRELYDSEEIDRFLNLFAAYVTEVRLPGSPTSLKGKGKEPAQMSTEMIVEPLTREGTDIETDWIPIHGPTTISFRVDATSPPIPFKSISDYIAQRYIVPKLPPTSPPAPVFTFGRFRVTTQRLFLAVEPTYKPFFRDLARLATWKDWSQSLMYCILFWSLWWYNLLLPSFLLRIFFALIRRKLFPYPTLDELRRRRKEVARAAMFGEAVQARLMPSSPFGLTEIWRIFRIFNKPKVDKAKKAMNSGKNKAKRNSSVPEEKVEEKTAGTESQELPDEPGETKEVTDGKRAILQLVTDIADLHERVKNIFLWRKPAASYLYGGVILFLFAVMLLLPAKYIAKLAYAIGGIFFWHITPIFAAMSAADRARLPPAFDNVPTDADYAMELISQRVASGLDITPIKRPKTSKARYVEINADDAIQSEAADKKPIDWKMWADRAARATSWADDGKRLLTGAEWRQSGVWPPRNPLMPEGILLHSVPSPHIETHTFPAQHTSAPGLITLTPSNLYFTPLMSASAKISIPINELRGVKKTGILKGLSVRWAQTQEDGNDKENLEKFHFVGDRDELFARLIAPDGQRWLKF